MLSIICKNNTVTFTSGIQGVVSRIITTRSTLHLFAAQEIVGFLILGMQSWALSGQSNGREGRWGDSLAESTVLEWLCHPCCCLAWKEKGGEVEGLQTLHSNVGSSAKGGWSKGRMTRSEGKQMGGRLQPPRLSFRKGWTGLREKEQASQAAEEAGKACCKTRGIWELLGLWREAEAQSSKLGHWGSLARVISCRVQLPSLE